MELKLETTITFEAPIDGMQYSKDCFINIEEANKIAIEGTMLGEDLDSRPTHSMIINLAYISHQVRFFEITDTGITVGIKFLETPTGQFFIDYIQKLGEEDFKDNFEIHPRLIATLDDDDNVTDAEIITFDICAKLKDDDNIEEG